MKKYFGKLTYSHWINGQGWQLQDAYAGVDDQEAADPAEIKDWDRAEFISYLLSEYQALNGLSPEEIESLANGNADEDTLFQWSLATYDDETDAWTQEIVHEIWLSELAKISIS